tara:strand:- start:4786 stop:5157 length:372 start_codon:yes stop_codon:yes gene_type:complete
MTKNKILTTIDECNRLRSKTPFIFLYLKLKEGKTLSDMAKHIGISRQSIHGWKSGAVPLYTNLASAADYLEVPSESIMNKEKFIAHLQLILDSKLENSEKNELIEYTISLLLSTTYPRKESSL